MKVRGTILVLTLSETVSENLQFHWKEGAFLDNLKIAKVILVYKVCKKDNLNNCRPISVLLSLLKARNKRVMCNHVCSLIPEKTVL